MAVTKAQLSQLGRELDECTRTAIEWPQPDSPWTDALEKAQDDLEKAKTTAAGRGIAIAMAIVKPALGDSDAIIRESVRRIRSGENEEVSEPEPVVRRVVERTSDEPGGGAAPEPPAPRTERVTLTAEHEAAIRTSLDAGFDAETLSRQFGIPLAQIQELA